MQYVDLFTWLRGDILVKADKMTMANSLELRVPFLDPEVFRVASTLPIEAAGHQGADQGGAAPGAGRDRPAARAGAAQARLPGADPALAQGRDVRLGPGRSIEASGTDHLLDRAAVLRMLDEHRAGPHDYSRKLWTLLVFMIWHGIFVEQPDHPGDPGHGLPGRL